MRAFVDKVVPILGWPKSVYSDNGSHFTGAAIQKMWADHGVMHFSAAISHPQSVGLSERYVQIVMGRIRLRCISAGTSRNWGLLLKDALIDINTRCIRIHGYTPSEILLGFNAATSRRPVVGDQPNIGDPRNNWACDDQVQEADEDTIHVRMDVRDERGAIAGQKLARSQDQRKSKPTRGYRSPKVGDLVLVRDIQLAK